MTTREPLGTDDGEGVQEKKSEPWWSVTLVMYTSRKYGDYSMRRLLQDFGRAAVQPDGSHGVALLSHRRGSSSVLHVYVCDSFQTCIHHAPAHADLCVCVLEARETTRRDIYLTLQGEPVIRRQFAETKEEREKIDVTVCYRLKNNFHLLGSILVMQETSSVSHGRRWTARKRQG